MLRYALPLFTVTAFASPAAADIQVQTNGPVIELSVFEQVEVEPDIATISAGVSTEARTAVEALRLNSQQMRSVIERIKSLGIDEDDIQTTGINLNAQYDYNQNTNKQTFRGYQVSNRVSVKLREIEETGEVLDALVAAGANDLSGPNFSVENDDAAKAAARRSAMTRAQTQAMEYAQLAGYSNVRILQISESISGHAAQPYADSAPAVKAVSASESAPVQPGRISTGVSISVTYEMVN